MKRYSDYIALQDFLPVYDITAEKLNSWQSFIPTQQFCELLQKTITAITSHELAKRKSMWIRGTFGTGKSHASSVIKHLLCDELSSVESYLSNIGNDALRNQLISIREGNCYFPVVLKGVEGAYDIPRFSLTLQREIKKALTAAGHKEIVTTSDYETAVVWIEKHRSIFEEILAESDSLKMISSNAQKIIDKLNNCDTDTYIRLDNTLSEHDIHLTSKSISEWIVEIENEIEDKKIANGLIIFWDEFTSVMDTIKSDRINVLQNIAEKTKDNNVFLFLISHRTEQQSLDNKGKDITRMNDRFESVEYKMDEVSTYLIMRHTFRINDNISDIDYLKFKYNRTERLANLLEYLSPFNDVERDHISDLFPLHPYTAYLCSVLSNYIGSANRSVIRFMNDEESGFRCFLTDESAFAEGQLLTADRLWDFFYSEFDSDPRCNVFTNVYRTEELKVNIMGDDYLRVFKVILLLNALLTKFSDKKPERIIPNEKNLGYLFACDRIESKLKDILAYISDNKIISQDVWGEFKISANSYNPKDLAEEKTKILASYKTATDFLGKYAQEKINLQEKFVVGKSLIRKCDPLIFACEEGEQIIRSKLKKYVDGTPNSLHIVLFLAVSEDSRNMMLNRVRDFSMEYSNTILVIPDEVFTIDYQAKFVDIMCGYNLAKRNFNDNEAANCEKTANQYITNWIRRLISGTYELFFNGLTYKDGTIEQLPKLINNEISPKIFSKGLETVKKIRTGSTTFWETKDKPQKLVLQILQARDRSALTTHASNYANAKYVFEDNDINLVSENCILTDAALTSSAWLVDVCRQMDKCIDEAHKKYQDRFSLSEILAPFIAPPFGFFASPANWVALAYALRKHKADLFDPSISAPISDEKLTDMLIILFKMWGDGISESHNKLLLRFGSPEESRLTKQITEYFNLREIDNIDNIKSLGRARWGVQEYCKTITKFPLWTLLYCNQIKENENLPKVVKEVVSLFEQESPKLERIKELSNLMASLKVEIPPLFTNSKNYEEGFIRFVEECEVRNDLQIKKEWWDEMLTELSYLPSEVAFRKEVDVEKTILQFYIKKTTIKTTPAPSDNPLNNGKDKIEDRKYTINENVINKAKSSIKNTNMPNMMWQKLMLDLMDERPDVSEFIANYLS